MDAQGNLYSWGSQFHPNEHVLQMTREDLLALPAVVRNFNGFYSKSGIFVMMNSMRILMAEAIFALVVIGVLVWALTRYVRRRKRIQSATQRESPVA